MDPSTVVTVALIQTPIVVVLTLLITRAVNRSDARRRHDLTATIIRKWGEGGSGGGGVEGLGFDYLLRDVGWRSGDPDLLFKGALLNSITQIAKQIARSSGQEGPNGTSSFGLSTKRDAETFGNKFFGES